MAEIGGTFRQPFAEQVAAFRLRLGDLVPTSRWDDIQRNAHDRAFMVAGATKADLLADLGAAVDRAISEGTGFEAFKKDFRGIVEKHGWHGWTGEGTARGEAWRMRTIYRTNMRTSYMAGRHAQLIEGDFPLWVYRHSGAVEPRLQHLAWDGLILKRRHDFWKTHFPPNGWGCGCRVFGARSQAAAKRRGGDPSVELEDGWDAADPATGAPKGIGKGWDYAPGATAADTVRAMTEKTVNWPFALARAFMDDLPPQLQDRFSTGYRDLPSLATSVRQYAQAAVAGRPTEPMRTLGRMTAAHRREIGDITGLDLDGYHFILDRSAAGHVMRAHGNARTEAVRGQIAVEIADFARLPAIFNAPDAIVDRGVSDLGQPVVQLSRTIGGRTYFAVLEIRGPRRRTAVLKSMWVRRASGDPPA